MRPASRACLAPREREAPAEKWANEASPGCLDRRGRPACRVRKADRGTLGRQDKTEKRGSQAYWARQDHQAFRDRLVWWANPASREYQGCPAIQDHRAARVTSARPAEMARTGWTVSLVCPVPVETEASQARTASQAFRG